MRRLVIALAIAAVACGGRHRGPARPETPPETVEGAKSVVEKWRQAYEVRSVEGLAQLYAHEPDTAVIQEGQLLAGWPAIEAMLKDRLAKATSVHLRITNVSVSAIGADGVRLIAELRRELGDATVQVAETGIVSFVLRRDEAAGWVIVLEHFSLKRS